MNKIIAALFASFCILFPLSAYAADALPEKGITRIKWSIENCGPMPKMMIVSLIAIAVMIIITVVCAKHYTKEENADEKS